jgi:hypothetical protein
MSCSVASRFDHSFLEMTTNAVVSSSVGVIVGEFRFVNASQKALRISLGCWLKRRSRSRNMRHGKKTSHRHLPAHSHVKPCSVAWKFDHSFFEMRANAVGSDSADVIVGNFRIVNASEKALRIHCGVVASFRPAFWHHPCISCLEECTNNMACRRISLASLTTTGGCPP